MRSLVAPLYLIASAGTFGVFALVLGNLPGGGIYTSVLASLAIGILMDAFLFPTLLIPATVALLGPGTGGHPATASRKPPGNRNQRRNRRPATDHGADIR